MQLPELLKGSRIRYLAWLIVNGSAQAAIVIAMALLCGPALLAMPGERNVYVATVGAALMVGAAFKALCDRRAAAVDGAAPGVPRWLRRASVGIVGLWLGLCLVEQGLVWCVTATSEKVLRDLQAQLPQPPRDARIYVVNQCPLNSIGSSGLCCRHRYSLRISHA